MEIIKNGKVFTKNFTFEKADIILDKGEIKDIIYFGNNGDSTNNTSDISGSTLLAALLIMVNATAASSDGMFNQKENTKVSTSMIQ